MNAPKITTIEAGLARVNIYGGQALLTRNHNGKWQARPERYAFTVGMHWPTFSTRNEAAAWVTDIYGTGTAN